MSNGKPSMSWWPRGPSGGLLLVLALAGLVAGCGREAKPTASNQKTSGPEWFADITAQSGMK